MTIAVGARRPRAVLLTPAMPRPSGGGLAMRARAWMATLARSHDLTVVHVGRGEHGSSSDAVAEVLDGSACRQVVPFHERVLAVLYARRDGRGVEDWVTVVDDAGERLARALGAEPIDRLVVLRLYLHDVASSLRAHTTVLRSDMDLDDLESATRRSIAGGLLRHARPLRALRTLRSAQAYEQLERRVLPAYDHLWLAAPEDVADLPDAFRARASVFPNRVPVPSPHSAAVGGPRFAFIGTLGYAPNELAAEFLVNEVAPRLAERMPEARIVIAGLGASARLLRRLSRSHEVDFLGAVDDPAAVLATATAALAPLEFGGGTKLKVIEALAQGVPVIAGAHAVRGLGLVHDRDVLVANSADDYVAACIRVSRDSALHRRLAESGRARHEAAFALPDV